MPLKTILLPMAALGSDPTEVAVPWRILTSRGHRVVIATPQGAPAEVDARMLTGADLGVWKPFLRANAEARRAYLELAQTNVFHHPLPYSALGDGRDFDALLLPGGHDKPIRQYLESSVLAALTARFFDAGKPVAAICHGVLVAGRARRADGRSQLYGRKTTTLTRQMEMAAYRMTQLWLKDYYRTYDQTTEDEVRSFLQRPEDFMPGPLAIRRDTDTKPGFCVRDGNYISARWPGDSHAFGHAIAGLF